MSQTFSLVCHEKRKRVWIGQGQDGLMGTFYSGEKQTMRQLHRFFLETTGSPVELICNDWASDDVASYDEIAAPDGDICDGITPQQMSRAFHVITRRDFI